MFVSNSYSNEKENLPEEENIKVKRSIEYL